MDFQSRIMHRADLHRQRNPLQQGEVDMDIEPLRLMSGEAVGEDLEPFPDGVQVIETFLQPEVRQVVRTDLVAQKHGELLVLLDEGVLTVGAENMVALLDLFDDIGQLAFEPACQPDAEDLADLVRRQPPKSQLAAAFEDLMDGKMALEDEIAAVLDLAMV